MASKFGLRGAVSPKILLSDRPRCAECGATSPVSTSLRRAVSRNRLIPFRGQNISQEPIRSRQYRCQAGKGNDEDPKKDGKKDELTEDLENFVMSAGSYGGLSGTAAVLFGYWLSIDPFGNFHFSWHDLLIGFECMLPSFLFQFVILSRSIQQRPSAGKMISIASEDGRLVIEPVSMGSDAPPKSDSGIAKEIEIFKQAARAYAMKRVLNSNRSIKGMTGSLPLFVVFLVISNLAEEMLFRGVGLTALSLWVRDRFYEAGAQDLFFDMNYPTVEAAKWGALVIVALAIVGNLVNSLQDTKERKEKLQGVLDNFATEVQQMSGMENVAKVIDPKSFPDRASEMIKVYMLQKVVGTLDALLEAVGASAGFILTGNLFASFVPVVLAETIGVLQSIDSLYDDLKAREIGTAATEVKDPEKLGELQVKMNDLKVRLLVTAVKRYLELEEANTTSNQESGSNSGNASLLSENSNGANDKGSADEQGEEKVDVSVNGEVLLMLVRREIGNLNSSIREEKGKEDSDAERLAALENDRRVLSELLPEVEAKVKENPEAQLGSFLGKQDSKSKETVGAGQKESNSEKEGD